MRYLYLFSFCLIFSGARAQNFRPFRPGGQYQYSRTSADSLYTFQLQRNGYQVGDSIYFFNYKVGIGYNTTGAVLCREFRYADNLLGNSLRIINGGPGAAAEYGLTFGNPRTLYPPPNTDEFILKPRAPLNQPWSLHYGNLTARVTARVMSTVLGQPDSVVSITFSDGRLVRLSKNYGLVESPALLDYNYRRSATIRQLTLSALPGRLGLAALTPRAIYNFQAGDVFWYNTYQVVAPNPTPGPNYNYADSVMTRTTSRTGDTLTYRIWRCVQSQQMGSSYILTVSASHQPMLARFTGEFIRRRSTSGPQHGSLVARNGVRRAQWNNRTTWQFDGNYYNQGFGGTTFADTACIRSVGNFVGDDGERFIYATGLGQTNYYEQNTTCCWQGTDLIGYRKGTERWGSTPRLACRPTLAVAAAAGSTRSTTSPNPFTAVLTIACVTRHPQALALELRDVLGRSFPLPPQTLTAGPQQVNVATAGLPAGVYSLLLHFGGEGRHEVMRVVKAD